MERSSITVDQIKANWETFKAIKQRELDDSDCALEKLAEYILDENEIEIFFPSGLDMFLVSAQMHIFDIPPTEIKRENPKLRDFLNSLTKKERNKISKTRSKKTSEEQAVDFLNNLIRVWNAKLP